jgi:hypothetical protein
MAKKIKEGTVNCGLNDILFPVELIDNPDLTNSEYAKVVVGQTPRGEMKLNYCSNVYALVPNAEIFPNIEAILKSQEIEFEASYTHVKHVRFYANYKITDKRYQYSIEGTNDVVFPKLNVQHSYNGKTNYRIMFGYFRLVCTNGLTIPVKEMKDFNLTIGGKHTINIKHSLTELNEMLVFFVNNAELVIDKITGRFNALAQSFPLIPSERVEEVLKASGIIAVDNAKLNTVNFIMLKVREEADKPNLGYNGRINDWLIYNGINQYIFDDNRNIAIPEKRMATDSTVLEYMLRSLN